MISTYKIKLFSCILAIYSPLLVAAESGQKSIRTPNVIIILADDLGWNGLSCYGNQLVRTPYIDRLAKSGIQFTNAYVTPICSPTRAELLTGKHSARLNITKALGIPETIPEARHKGPTLASGVLNSEYTLAEAFKSKGYQTAHFGKWHVGHQYTPTHPDTKKIIHNEFGFDVTKHGQQSIDFDKSVSELTNETIQFIKTNKDHPFFIYFAHQTVHTRCRAPKNLVDQYTTEKRKPAKPFPHEGINNATYLAMIKHLDNETGRLLNKLEEMNLRQNTLVIFLSDNGGATRVTSNNPLRRGKCEVYEGGIKVPMIASWPGVIPENSKCTTVIKASLDLYPTLLHTIGHNISEKQVFDGVNITPLLLGHPLNIKRNLYWHVPHYIARDNNHFRITPHSAVRSGEFKLIEFINDYYEYSDKTKAKILHAAEDFKAYPLGLPTYIQKPRFELYNIDKDPKEEHDLINEKPEKVAELKKVLQNWRRSVGAKMPELK